MVCFSSRSGNATEGESGSVGSGSGVGESKGKHCEVSRLLLLIDRDLIL